MTFLKINNLSVNYEMRRETVYAAKKVNINVEKGEILGLVGESGSGKSTVGNAIINLIDEPGKVSGGSIILDGTDIYENPENILKLRGKKIGLISRELHDEMAIYVLIFAIGISEWPQFARVTRAATLVEKNKEYISASKIIGLSNFIIMFKHILPNILRPVLVIATIGLALAIITESTLSFLGVGVPPTTPSLGTLIRFGNNFLFSGEWWITFFPAIFLVILALSINLLGDWMRDTLNPKLKTR